MKGNFVLYIVGSGDAFSSNGRYNACSLVSTDTTTFLVDCGASSLPGLRKTEVDIASIDAIFITHLHGDHFGGVPFLLLLRMKEGKETKPLKIIGPEGTEATLKKSHDLFFPGAPMPECDYLEYQAGKRYDMDGLEFFAIQALHETSTHPHSLQIKVRDKILAFSGDTEWHEGLKDVYDNADVFVCECTKINPMKGHVGHQDLVSHKQEINARRIVLTHMSDEVLNLVHPVFERAFDGQKIVLSNGPE